MAYEVGKPGRVQRQKPASNPKRLKPFDSPTAGKPLSEVGQLQRQFGNEGLGQLIGGQPNQESIDRAANESFQAIVNRPIIQPKLQVNQPNDPYEQEADRVANQPQIGRQEQAPAGTPPAIQRDVPQERYAKTQDGQETEDGKATKDYANKLDTAVGKAWAAVQNSPLLGGFADLDGHTQLWVEKIKSFAKAGEDPHGLHTAFGYVIESLVSNEQLRPAAPAGYTVITQGSRGGTRPDFILRKGFQDVGWLDITASKSETHIFNKAGGWDQVENIAEITYPSIDQTHLQAMKKIINKDKSGELDLGLDPEEVKKRMAKAKKILEAKQIGWNLMGETWLDPVKRISNREVGGDERRANKTKTILQTELHLSEKPDDRGTVSLLMAMDLLPRTFGFSTGVSGSTATGISQLQELDPEINWFIPRPTPRGKPKSKEEKRKASFKKGIDPEEAKEKRRKEAMELLKKRRQDKLMAARGLGESGENTPMEEAPTVTENDTNATNNSNSPDNQPTPPTAMETDDTIIQPKLQVNQPNDPFEQEADHIAHQVTRPGTPLRPGTIQAKSITATSFKGNQASETVQREIEGRRGQGQTLNNKVRQPMEQAFGNSFQGVNIHTDGKADSLNRELGARAFTTGRDIFFRQGEYQPEAPAGQKLLAHELTHVVQQGGATNAVQRSVGFEFEDSSWRAWKYDVGGLRPAARKEVLHRGNHFTLEGDDTPGPQASNLEFVTEPFETTPAGMGQLNNTMTEIQAIVGRIGQFSGRPGNLQNTDPDQFVLGHQHQLQQPNTRLSAGQPHARFKMQATQGISIEDLPTIMEHFGTPAGEQAAQTDERGPSRQAVYGDPNYQNGVTNVMGNAPRLAREAVNAFIPQLPEEQRPLFDNRDALIGLVSAIIMYIKLLAVPRGNVLKYSIPLLVRNDFVALFRSIPPVQRLYLPANRNLLFQAIMEASNQQGYMPRPAQAGGGFWDENRQLDHPLLTVRIRETPESNPNENIPVMNTLSTQNWLDGIVQNGIDYFKPQTMLGWLEAHEQHLNPDQRQRGANMLESFASLGGNKDDAEQAGKSKLGIFENRGIIPQGVGVDIDENQAHRTALNYLHFFVNLRQNGGNPGQFPNNDIP